MNKTRLVAVPRGSLQAELTVHGLGVVGEGNHGGETAIKEKLERGENRRVFQKELLSS